MVVVVGYLISRETNTFDGNEMFNAHLRNREQTLYNPYMIKDEERKIPEEVKNYALYYGISHMIHSPEARLVYETSLMALFDPNPNKWRDNFYVGQKKIEAQKKSDLFSNVEFAREVEKLFDMAEKKTGAKSFDMKSNLDAEMIFYGYPLRTKDIIKNTIENSTMNKSLDKKIAQDVRREKAKQVKYTQEGIALVLNSLPPKKEVKELDMDFETFNNMEKRGFNLAVEEIRSTIRDLQV